DFGSELAMGLKFLTLRRKMSGAEVDRIMAQLNDPEMLDAIVRYGDMDRPSSLFRHLARRPGLIRIFGTLFMVGIREKPE
ncbi:MAG TPA: NAD(P)/FAD-dependent oxidoreductase, partial [Methanomicrobiales archaeon]|nr:NAD(P)/FAD-dependent oxidoreductase [Methanomicrobiales archaeon]